MKTGTTACPSAAGMRSPAGCNAPVKKLDFLAYIQIFNGFLHIFREIILFYELLCTTIDFSFCSNYTKCIDRNIDDSHPSGGCKIIQCIEECLNMKKDLSSQLPGCCRRFRCCPGPDRLRWCFFQRSFFCSQQRSCFQLCFWQPGHRGGWQADHGHQRHLPSLRDDHRLR